MALLSPCLSTSFLQSPGASGVFQPRVAPQQRTIRIGIRCGVENGSSNWTPADFVKVLGQNLWGRGLPPGALVSVAKELWTAGWLTMMAQLAPPTDTTKAYTRPGSQFRGRPRASSRPGEHRLFVAAACPWAHRAAIVHSLKGLQEAVPLSIAAPGNTGLWELSDSKPLLEVYKSQPGGYNGRATVPMLWNAAETRVVNNESADIIEILNSDFNHLALHPDLDLAPAHLKSDIATWNERIYANINNGVYRCGFAQSQEAYDSAVATLFSALDDVDAHLENSRYLCGDVFTLADVRLFTTLFRFDAVYQILFKCSKQKVAEFRNLPAYVRDVYQIPGVAETCDMAGVVHGYYKVLFPLNPGGISPAVPRVVDGGALLQPHRREQISAKVVSQ